MSKIGMVLEGGAMRGIYTAGVLDVLMDEKIDVDTLCGVSAGALFGINYVSGQRGRVLRYTKKYNKTPGYLGIKPLIKEKNIVSPTFGYNTLPIALDPFDNEAFQQSSTEFYAVVTDIDSGRAVYKKIEDGYRDLEWLRASGSMPYVSTPVEIDGRKYLDGGVADSIPIEWMLSQDVDKILVILTRQTGYRKKPASPRLVHAMAGYTPLADLMILRPLVYNRSLDLLETLEKKGKVFVLRPSQPIEVKKLEKDPEKLQTYYNLGVQDAKAQVYSLKKYLETT